MPDPYPLEVTVSWKKAYPGAAAGVLAMTGTEVPAASAAFEALKAEIEAGLRARLAGFDRAALAGLPTLQAYKEYYRRFKKTYHVLLQLESVLNGKPIPSGSPLVEAMFMAELKNQLLTAGHDLGALQGGLSLGVATGSESYVLFNGETQTLKPGDMFIADTAGVISSIIYGPDQRTRIRPETRRVLYTVYAPPGIGEMAVSGHLEELRTFVQAACPAAQVVKLKVYTE